MGQQLETKSGISPSTVVVHHDALFHPFPQEQMRYVAIKPARRFVLMQFRINFCLKHIHLVSPVKFLGVREKWHPVTESEMQGSTDSC